MIKLSIDFNKIQFNDQKLHLMSKSKFKNCVVDLKIDYKNITELTNITQFEQLKSLDITSSEIGTAGARFISQLKHLTKLDIDFNNIGAEGAVFIGKMD